VIGGKEESNNPRPQYDPVLTSHIFVICLPGNGTGFQPHDKYMDDDAVKWEARWEAFP